MEAAAAPALCGALWPGQDVSIACLVGSITPAKDHLLALDTAAVLHQRDPRWRFLLVGDPWRETGAYQRAVQERFRELRLENVCRFTNERTDAIARGEGRVCDALHRQLVGSVRHVLGLSRQDAVVVAAA